MDCTIIPKTAGLATMIYTFSLVLHCWIMTVYETVASLVENTIVHQCTGTRGSILRVTFRGAAIRIYLFHTPTPSSVRYVISIQ